MSKKLNALREERNQAVHEARQIIDRADNEKRELNSEERSHYEGLFAKQQNLRDAIEREERQIEAERELAGSVNTASGSGDNGEQRGMGPTATPEYRQAFNKLLRTGDMRSLNADEHRALAAGVGSTGGFFVTPQSMAEMLIKSADDAIFIRQKATKFQIPTAASLGAVSLDNDVADSDWTSEILTGSEDSSMTFGKRELYPQALAKRIKVSNALLARVPNSENLVMQRLGYKIGISQEKAFLTGDGVKKPLGLFTASSNGVSTARDVSTDNTTTEMTMNGLINAKYSLKGQYQQKASWLFHRDGVKQIAKMKDLEGQYIWQPSKIAGEPDTLLGMPVEQSEYAPNTFTTGLYVGLLGDFSYYWIADALDMQIQVLRELYAETNQTGYISRIESDGMPVLAEAFARVKLG